MLSTVAVAQWIGRDIAVVGAGRMGRGIALSFAYAGFSKRWRKWRISSEALPVATTVEASEKRLT